MRNGQYRNAGNIRHMTQNEDNENKPEPFNRNGNGGFGAVKSDSTHHFFGNVCIKSGPFRFSQFSDC